MSDYLGKDVFKLGFGLMRLPKNEDGSIDIPRTSEMVDRFIAAGGTYFDTAYVYDNGKSEEAARKALVDRYPRESYTLCTKLNAWNQAHDEASAKQQFYTSLERTGAGYFDFYLLHGLQPGNWTKYDEYHLWDFVQEQKAKGLLKHIGFSYHAGPEPLEKLLTDHPEMDFIQLQLNYADWENPGIAARANYEVARAHGVPVVIMEPVKGGALADPLPKVKEVFDAADTKASYASWAIRYAASLHGIITVLSGMSSLEQMNDNLSYMKDFQPLSAQELEVIHKAQEAMNEDNSIPCTACHYCTDGCPKQIPIPEIFTVSNRSKIYPSWDKGKNEYKIATTNRGKASDCIACGQCEAACPQQLSIINLLQECAASLE